MAGRAAAQAVEKIRVGIIGTTILILNDEIALVSAFAYSSYHAQATGGIEHQRELLSLQ